MRNQTVSKFTILLILFCLPAIACSIFGAADVEDFATKVAADIYATATAEAGTLAAAGPAQSGVINISPDGSGDFPSLEAAVEAAAPDSTIQIAPGTYQLAGKLDLTKPVNLVGAGMEQTFIVGMDETYVVRFSGPGKFSARDITFRYEGTRRADVLITRDAEIELTGCQFTGGVYDPDEDRGGSGLNTYGNSTGSVVNCRADSNGSQGFNLHDSTNLKLEGNSCSNNIQSGAAFWQDSTGSFLNNTCIQNGYHGIAIHHQAQPVIESNTLQGNQYSGIYYAENGGGKAVANQINQNQTNGIAVNDQANPTLQNNTINDNQENGIVFADSSGGEAVANDINRNAQCLSVSESADPVLADNTCDGSAEAGSDIPETGILLQDDFSDPNSGWEAAEYESGAVGYREGTYFVNPTSSEEVLGGTNSRELGDVVIDVDIKLAQAPSSGGSVAGVGCRVQRGDNAGDGYFMLISSDGNTQLNKSSGGTFETLVDWSPSAAIQLGDATNRVRAVCKGDQLVFYANGELLFEAADAEFNQGYLSFNGVVTNPEESAGYQFDNLVVYSPGSEEPLPTPIPPPARGPGEAYISPFVFAKDKTNDDKPVEPSTVFPHNTIHVYACYEYSGMDKFMTQKVTFFVDGKNFFTGSKKWDKGPSGNFCIRIGYQDGSSALWDGKWEVKLYIDGDLAQSGSFQVGP